MSHDIIIRNGLIIDGTGAPGRQADLAISGERIAAIGKVEGVAPVEIDAAGKLVTPGFVDIHTHLDAQLAWDPIASSSCYHGVTSVVLGNCGVTFAPCKPADRNYLANLMESVEDIPAASILEGLPWDWETYGEYLDSLSRMPSGVNVGGMVGHCAVRYHAMGERGLDDIPAGADDIARMCALVDEAMAAGALGFSTSRTFMHRVPDGRPVPGTYAREDELLAIGAVLGKYRRGVFEAAARLGERDNDALDNTRGEVAWMGEISRANGVSVTFGLTQSARRPELYRRVIEFSEAENARGAKLRPQTTSRGIGALFGIHNRTPYDRAPQWQALRSQPLPARLEALRRDRAALIAAAESSEATMPADQLFVILPGDVTYHNDPERSLAAHARRRGVSPAAAFIDLALETNGRAVCYYAFLNQSLDAVQEMILNPVVAMGLADSGAHVGQIMDASQPTWLLAHWVRDRGVITAEEAVRRWTSDTAAIFGIRERGTLRPGAFADVNVIDLDGLALEAPEYVHDFPGGAGRYVQRARGYAATLVNGQVFMRDGAPTGALAGQLLRSA
jgi:N-acyl-D-aspartate/D-glutamate deacylase